jgi:hypothetical protein
MVVHILGMGPSDRRPGAAGRAHTLSTLLASPLLVASCGRAVPVEMKTDQIRTDITDIVFVFIFMFEFGFEYG